MFALAVLHIHLSEADDDLIAPDGHSAAPGGHPAAVDDWRTLVLDVRMEAARCSSAHCKLARMWSWASVCCCSACSILSWCAVSCSWCSAKWSCSWESSVFISFKFNPRIWQRSRMGSTYQPTSLWINFFTFFTPRHQVYHQANRKSLVVRSEKDFDTGSPNKFIVARSFFFD